MDNYEDLQEKYRDRDTIRPMAIPLAADAAHLLSEYLDSLAIQLVRNGIDAPYRITQEYEEMLVQELQHLGTSSKLTYEVTAKVLEKYGTPSQLAMRYLTEQQPHQRQLLDQPEGPKDTRSQLVEAVIYSFFAVIIGMLIASFVQLAIPSIYVYWEPLVIVLYLLAALEVGTGVWGSGISPYRYELLRQITRFLATATAILFTWVAFDIGTREIVFSAWISMVVGWVVTMGIGAVRDHTTLLQSTASDHKPYARFILPSYLILGGALLTGSLALIVDDNRQFGDDSAVSLATVSMGLAVLSLVSDMRHRYPFSLKKLGYTIVSFTLLPLFLFTYPVQVWDPYGGYYDYMGLNVDWNALLEFWGTWIVALLVVVPLLFRDAITRQLAAYRLQLQGYQQ